MSEDRGTYVEHDGRPAVRFRRHLDHPPARVWAAITAPDELARWFPSGVTYEPHAGAAVTFAGDPHLPTTQGTVLAFDPPHRFAFTWGGDELHLTVEPGPDGGAILTLVNVLERRDSAARNATGWTVCLGVLARELAGERTTGPHGDDVPPFRPLYEAYVADGLPSGAPVPGDV
ncbi:SRPBCC family protein [Patulibacter sp. SYSU D01012]|uniref:SRPBCC family protein n=1 Tax=Patulibacter sp. SYSU D01012 TaxID=2817381 RepID=UPI001B30D39E|nr:SRPBCC family protein [Patulibacter sp. SYSU D01012]